MQEFSQLLADYQGGLLDSQLGRELEKVVAAVNKQGKKGSISLSLEIKPAGNGKVDLVANYVAKPPVDNTVKGLMWVDKNNNLVPRDPDQPDLPGIRIVSTEEPKQVREAI